MKIVPLCASERLIGPGRPAAFRSMHQLPPDPMPPWFALGREQEVDGFALLVDGAV